ncbi:retrovirus-related pol polyprotein from transposon TNT 1-94 [Tanacetum coccineum]
MIPNPDNDRESILEPLSKMTEGYKKQYISDDMWERIKRLMFGSDVTSHMRHSYLMDEFDKFAVKEGESLESNQDLLIIIYELKNKLQTVDKGKNVNTKFDKSETSGTLLCVTPLPKNIAVKAKKVSNTKVIQLVFWIVDSGCSKHLTGNLQLLINFVEKFMGTVHFENDHFIAITGYRDYVQGNLTICHVYYVEGLGHNLLSVRQFCDGDLEVSFCSNTCYVRNLEGDDLLTGSHDLNLYTISISEMAASSPVCLMSRATSIKSWLWHSYEQGKSKKASLPPKLVPSTESKLKLLHIDLCGPMRVASINGKKYILVIVDDYSWYTWVYFLRTKDKAPDMIIDFIN